MDCAYVRTARIDPDSAVTTCELTTKDYENLEFFDSVCYTCGVSRPNRSRHCRFTDKCVLEYDHYCYFLNKPIGKGNRKAFFFGLLVNFLAVWLFIVICWSMVNDRVQASGFICTYVVRLIKEFWKLEPELKICLLFSSCVAWYNFWYLVLALYSVANGLTIHEVVNRHRCRYLYEAYVSADDTVKMRFRNPFTKGVLNNFLDFLIN
jgi:ribosomal protein L40E